MNSRNLLNLGLLLAVLLPLGLAAPALKLFGFDSRRGAKHAKKTHVFFGVLCVSARGKQDLNGPALPRG